MFFKVSLYSYEAETGSARVSWGLAGGQRAATHSTTRCSGFGVSASRLMYSGSGAGWFTALGRNCADARNGFADAPLHRRWVRLQPGPGSGRLGRLLSGAIVVVVLLVVLLLPVVVVVAAVVCCCCCVVVLFVSSLLLLLFGIDREN